MAALPWAARAKSSSLPPQQSNDLLQPRSLDQLGLVVGDRIEVAWVVEDGGEPFRKWWGATILSLQDAAGQQQPSSCGREAPTYQLRYDPFGDDFAEESCVVQLLGLHQLWDAQAEAVLPWRRAGDDYEPPEGESEEERGDDGSEAQGGTVTLGQLASEIDEAEVAAAEASMLAELGGALGPAGTAHMAAGYRDFMEGFKAFIAAKAAASQSAGSGEFVVTDAMVGEFQAMLATQRAQRR